MCSLNTAEAVDIGTMELNAENVTRIFVSIPPKQ